MELRQIRYFVAVTRAEGFRKASRELYVAQPTLSVAVHQLESELGVKLLRRTARGVQLTAEGQRFLAHAEVILGRADRAKAEMRARAHRATPASAGSVAARPASP
ncbi:MAG TPA: LysR family transcriptional regulator [Solirubrobacteraceae bacterium]|jgi:DNA-binding transcriptional LysR family regulator|nr:LysR family transcriptional regulator [Solirubrobacteraceae bacterium]